MEISIGLLHGFDLNVNGESLELPLAAQRLLAFLALHERPLRRLYVAGVLWGETTEDRATASLRSTLWRLRRQGPASAVVGTARLALARDVRVDVREVTKKLHELAGDAGDPAAQTRLLPITAELLPDWDEDWVHVERERYRQFRLHTLETICEKLHARGRFAEAIQVALAAIAAEPLRDTAHRLLVSVYLSEGNRGEAVRQFHTYRELLSRELGVESAPEIESLLTSAVGTTTIKQAHGSRGLRRGKGSHC